MIPAPSVVVLGLRICRSPIRAKVDIGFGGLHNSYDQARMKILLKGDTPILNHAYAMFAEDEIHGLASNYITSDESDPIEMQLNKNSLIIYINQNYKGKRYDYLNFIGHTRENCYKLIGYPTN